MTATDGETGFPVSQVWSLALRGALHAARGPGALAPRASRQAGGAHVSAPREKPRSEVFGDVADPAPFGPRS